MQTIGSSSSCGAEGYAVFEWNNGVFQLKADGNHCTDPNNLPDTPAPSLGVQHGLSDGDLAIVCCPTGGSDNTT